MGLSIAKVPSEARRKGAVSVAIKYRFSQQQFSRAIGHNANFVWNQYETCGADFVRK